MDATTRPDEAARTERFGQTMSEVLNHAALALMASIGHRTGLFDAMAGLPPTTSEGVATAAGLNERYVREWLGAMVAGGVVEHDPDAGLYRLPEEHAAWLTRSTKLVNAAASAQWIAVLGAAETSVVDAFRHGRGVPYSAYPRFHQVMAEESQQSVVDSLMEHILPMAPGLADRLEAGADALDVGCGAGHALHLLAETFPASRFVGRDFSEEAIALARGEADRRGLNNVRFEVRDAALPCDPEAYDLITAFDAIHDQARPAGVLHAVSEALRPDGVFLMQDISGAGCHHRDASHPFGTFLYAISCMHCMSVSLANGGPGLGAMWGRPQAEAMLRAAGFNLVTVRESPHDPLNFYYVCRKG
ncbi:class I SAM-dependent methyltransferase [Planctomyces sp. SH-PL62]|uniref:class I SAM-dependent methyltransferase n=1 Tax=Planctomyces sp. SH-PL62 TaxID=1636152 RepID=UPI00078C6FDD|nr:class I SAM-dependent methyltransferase [Planctomyces sp. SH-PL62]AMV40908.1 putative methyltransferase YcgJ [Planctomyces sp. SH-PL62]